MKLKRLRTALTIVIAVLLGACGTTLDDYAHTMPAFDLRTFFTGELKGWGLVKNRWGKVTQRFSVDMRADWQGNNGELYELFKYSDGKIQQRTWHLVSHADGSSTGDASDVVGQARGRQMGFAFHWSYQLRVDTDDGQLQVTLDDWLYQIDQQAVVSQAQIRKFGVRVGEVLVFIVKQ